MAGVNAFAACPLSDEAPLDFGHLPEAAQVKLLERRLNRASLGHRLQPLLLDDDNGLL